MKKKYIVLLISIILIIIAIASWFAYKTIEQKGREYEIKQIEIENYNYFILKQDGKYGVIDKEGNIIVDCEFTNLVIPDPTIDVFICYNNQETKVLNKSKENIFAEYSEIKPIKLKNIASELMYEKNLLTYKKEDKIGLIDLQGKIIAKPIYEEVDALEYKEGELLVKQDGKYGIINNKGNYLVKPEYDQITVDNYATTEEGYKKAGYIVSTTTEEGYRYGYIDVKGNILLEPEYNEVIRISDIKDENNIYLIVAKNGQYGIFKNDTQIINSEYQSISYNSEHNILIVEKTKKFGISDLEGKSILPIQFNQIDCTGMYIYATNDKGEVDVYNTDGTVANIDSNIYILETDNSSYKIQIDNLQGSIYSIVDSNNNKLTQGDYSYIKYLYDNHFIVSVSGGKLGIINDKDEKIVEIKYDSIENIDGTDCIVTRLSENNLVEIYNKKLEKICEMPNAIVETENNYIKIYNDDETIYFDYEGNKKDNKEIFQQNEIYANKQNEKWGFVDKSGNVIIDYIYDKVTDINVYGYAGIKQNGKWGVIDKNGNIVKEPTYTFNNQAEPEFLGEYYKVEYGYGEFYYTK